ncbi:MAG: hypothetical protein A2511_00640 [Deltaproteobacteria bacterium RIFOXYD12_FULL_50_9]|nr:MAG: hypothetical protein A2511_00640 [Deltaproteobacteria bacterium RIFOXYD12_FULL_50_9]
MDGSFQEGWYKHPTLGLIKIFQKNYTWVYMCYASNGQKPLSKDRPLDQWTWALSEPEEI